jgi:hypothetical protein
VLASSRRRSSGVATMEGLSTTITVRRLRFSWLSSIRLRALASGGQRVNLTASDGQIRGDQLIVAVKPPRQQLLARFNEPPHCECHVNVEVDASAGGLGHFVRFAKQIQQMGD